MSHRWLTILGAGMAAILVLLLGVVILRPGTTTVSLAAPGSQQPTTKDPGISVTGEGVVYAQPDIATINVGVLSEGRTAQEVQENNGRVMNAVVEAITQLGIDKKDIRTGWISLYPQNDRNGQQITGYRASNSVTVTVRDLSKAGTVLDNAVKAGANTSYSISFGFSDDSRYRNDALKQAVAAARSRAEAMASAAGLSIKGVVSLSDELVSIPGRYDATTAPAAAPGAESSKTVIEPGQQAVRVRVHVIYSY